MICFPWAQMNSQRRSRSRCRWEGKTAAALPGVRRPIPGPMPRAAGPSAPGCASRTYCSSGFCQSGVSDSFLVTQMTCPFLCATHAFVWEEGVFGSTQLNVNLCLRSNFKITHAIFKLTLSDHLQVRMKRSHHSLSNGESTSVTPGPS